MADGTGRWREGRIEQAGAPLALYERPATRYVAGFLGSPAMNFVPAQLQDSGTPQCSCPTAASLRARGGAKPAWARAAVSRSRWACALSTSPAPQASCVRGSYAIPP